MKIFNRQAGITGQNGIALLVLVIAMALAISVFYLSSISVDELKVERIQQTQSALKRAKQALIAYAVTYSDSKTKGYYGFLPCPDYNNGLDEGLEDNGNCGARSISKLGYLPWRTLGIPPLKDESGTCLMYAVTGEYKNDESAAPSYKSSMLNEDTYGMFEIVDAMGSVSGSNKAADRIVAIVFAPGKPLSYQSRSFAAGSICGEGYSDFSAYLDAVGAVNNANLSVSADELDQFVHAVPGSSQDYNDRFLTITRTEIWQAIMQRDEFDASVTNGKSRARRVTEALARCLAQYGNDNNNSRLPYPALTNLGGNDYRFDINYDAAASGPHFGRYPFIVDSADSEIPGTIGPSALFDKDFTSPPAGVRACDDLPILYPAGADADLRSDTSADRIFWQNWKDHFFYAVSRAYRPASMPLDPGPPRCGSCIHSGASPAEYAAVVIYSGEKQAGQIREYPIAVTDTDNTKGDFNNYIEVKDAAGNGSGDYTPTGNDIMFCITDTEPLDVVPCP